MAEAHHRARHRGAGAGAQVNAAPTTPSRVSPARSAAFAILEQLATSSAHSDDLLHGPALEKLSQPDRNLTTALVMGVLRWQIALEQKLLPLLARPDQALSGPVQTSLLLGAFQLLHMDRVPAHAALNESVELVRWAGEPHAAGLVNAVLRKLAAGPRDAPKPIVEKVQAAALRLGHPSWLVERWAQRYGRSAALAICEYGQHEPAGGDLFREAPFAPSSPQDGESIAEQSAGSLAQAVMMDDGSRLVAELAAASHSCPARIWDCCAAPGGKTAILARRLPQADVLATDLSPRRLQSMARRVASALPGQNVRTAVADAADPYAAGIEGSFDLILCDVPCSGTGTLARNPEIRLRLQPADLPRQAERQERILRSALSRLAPGGRLLYSTCSLEPEENENVVETVRNEFAQEIEFLPLLECLQHLQESGVLKQEAPLQGLTTGPYLRTLPGYSFRGDGFFAALFARQG